MADPVNFVGWADATDRVGCVLRPGSSSASITPYSDTSSRTCVTSQDVEDRPDAQPLPHSRNLSDPDRGTDSPCSIGISCVMAVSQPLSSLGRQLSKMMTRPLPILHIGNSLAGTSPSPPRRQAGSGPAPRPAGGTAPVALLQG